MRCQADVAERVAAAPTPQAAASLREGPPDWAPDTRCARPIQDLRCVIPSLDRGRVLLCASVRRCQKCHPLRVLLRVYVTASDLSVEYNRQETVRYSLHSASFRVAPPPRAGHYYLFPHSCPLACDKKCMRTRVIRSASPGTRARLTYTFPARACPPAGRERPFIVCTAHEGRVYARSCAPPSVSCSRRRLSPHRGGGGAPCRNRLRKPAVMDGTCETRSRKPLLVFRAEMAEQSPTACDDPPAPPLRA